MLIKDNFYYFELFATKSYGTAHVSLAVESPSNEYKPNSRKQILNISTVFNPKYEKVQMKLWAKSNSNIQGTWSFKFNGKVSRSLSWGATSEDIKYAFSDTGFEKNYVERYYLNENGEKLIEDPINFEHVYGY